MAWLSDDRIVAASPFKILRIWNLITGTQEGWMEHQSSVSEVIATQDGRIISCAEADERLRVWNTDTEELTDGPWSIKDYGHAMCMALSQNEELLASYHEKEVVIWEMAGTMRFRNSIDHHSTKEISNPNSICFSPDGDKLAICVHPWTILVFDAASGETIFGPLDDDDRIYAVVWSSEQSDRLFCACWDGQIISLDSSTGEIIDELSPSQALSESQVACLSLSPDGKWLASGSFEPKGTVRLWNVGSRLPIGEPLIHGGSSVILCTAFSRSGEFIACTGKGGKILVWRVPWWDSNNRKTLDPLLDQSAVVSPDGPSNIVREPDFNFLDVPASHRHRPLQDHSRMNPSDPPSRVQRSRVSWRFWNMIPRFVYGRSYPISMGWGEPRTYVASRSTISSDPSSHSPEVHPTVMFVVESDSGESSEDSEGRNNLATEPEVIEIGCCGLLSRQRPRAPAVRERDNVLVEQSLPRNSLPESSSHGAGIPNHPPSRPTAQDMLELPAVV